MHQPFTEPVTPVHRNDTPDIFQEVTATLRHWLDEAEKHYRRIKNQNVSKAQYELMCKYGEQLAVIHFDEWQKFYRNNVGERCDYDKLQRLFYKFYKIKQKARQGWSLW